MKTDILGDGFEQKLVAMPADHEGPVVTTIIRRLRAGGAKCAVLYVHGFSDYFFNAEMGRKFNDAGYDFYAVDLRKYGRSLLQGQKIFGVADLSEYFPDIEAGLEQIRADGHTEIVLMGHSTGGLTASLFMKRRAPADVRALILNSPFLSWNLPWLHRHVAIPAITLLSRWSPGLKIPQPKDPGYAYSLHKAYGGEWDYDRTLKPDVFPDIDAAWVAAIERGQRQLRGGADIRVPILLLRSKSSVGKRHSRDQYRRADAILNVETLAAVGRRLGKVVTEVAVKGGLHDLLLSSHSVREQAYSVIFDWLKGLGL